MPLMFHPSIFRNGQFHALPQPVLSVRIHDTWDFAQFKVPLAVGETLAGHSQNGAVVQIEGRTSGHTGGPQTREAAMWNEIAALRAVLNVASADEKYDLFLYRDDGSAEYRYFKFCTTLRFDYDLADKNGFGYSIAVHAEDPAIHTAPPATF
jgi:hypothetical protein